MIVAAERTPWPAVSKLVFANTGSPRLGSRFRVPFPPTPLIGPDRAVQESCDLLRDPDIRLMTITGPPGVGKTRVAIEATSQIGDSFEDGAMFVDLAPLGDPGLVLQAIAQTLGMVDIIGLARCRCRSESSEGARVAFVLRFAATSTSEGWRLDESPYPPLFLPFVGLGQPLKSRALVPVFGERGLSC